MEKSKITKEVLLKFLQDNYGSKEVTMESNLISDLGMDSLDTIELVMELEKMGFEIPDENLENFHTVQDVWDYISNQIWLLRRFILLIFLIEKHMRIYYLIKELPVISAGFFLDFF